MRSIADVWPMLGSSISRFAASQPLDVAACESEAKEPPALPRVLVLENVEELRRYVPQWEELADTAIEPNVFYRPWMLLPALEHFGSEAGVRVVLILDGPPQAPRLIGLFPLTVRRRFRGMPVSVVRLWRHCHCYLTSPLIRRGAEDACWESFFRWLSQWRDGGMLLELDTIPSDQEIGQTLADYIHAARLPVHVADVHTRALLVRDESGESYLRASVSPGLRRSLSRKRRRLALRGEVVVRPLQPGEDIAPWLERFLQLEVSGWKGRAGTAVLQRPAEIAFFTATTTQSHLRGQLIMLSLEVDGRAIAMQVNIMDGEGGFALKCAYDEAWQEYSPGALLEYEAVRAFHDRPGMRWVDSCSAPTNTLMKRLWRQRRTIVSLILPTGKRWSYLLAAAIPLGRQLRHSLRSLLGLKPAILDEECL